MRHLFAPDLLDFQNNGTKILITDISNTCMHGVSVLCEYSAEIHVSLLTRVGFREDERSFDLVGSPHRMSLGCTTSVQELTRYCVSIQDDEPG